MLKNKKAEEGITIIPAALVKIFIAAAIVLLIILPAGSKLYAFVIGSDKKYDQAFKDFTDKIDKMNIGRDTIEISLKQKSAIVGFSKNAENYGCFNCYGSETNRPTIIFNKPLDIECKNSACICLCGEIQLLQDKLDGKSVKYIQCHKPKCKQLAYDIVDKTILKLTPRQNILITTLGWQDEYWNNGFLFTNGIAGANDLKLYDEQRTQLIVEKRSNLIGVCNVDIMEINKGLGYDSCIITEFDEAKKLEQNDMEKAVQKYKDFLAKYSSGRETEESMLKIGKYYFAQGKYVDSAEILCRLIENFPASSYRAEAGDIMNKIDKSTAGIKVCS